MTVTQRADSASLHVPAAGIAQPAAGIALSWSGGKDSTMTLHALRSAGLPVRTLLTTVTRGIDRIAMHGVRRGLLAAQADALGLPLHEVFLDAPSSNEAYEAAMRTALAELTADGIDTVAFGDLYLEDIRAYREDRMTGTGLTPIFPVWGRDTTEFFRDFLGLGFRAVIVCVDTRQLDGAFAGRELDEALLADLPAGADPCGENGEFHTFVYDGPGFREPIRFERGEQILRDDRFRYQELLPVF